MRSRNRRAHSVLGALMMMTGLVHGGEAYQPIQTGGAEGVIVPKEKAAEFWHLQGRSEQPSDTWTPRAEDVQKLEEKLGPYLQKTSMTRAPDLAKKLSDYKRQYVGIVLGGRKVIYVNCVCNAAVRSSFADWQSRPVQVDDGGDCFFQVDYDTESGQLSNLMVNGEA